MDYASSQAFLNYLLLDDNMNVVSEQSGFVQTTVANSWNQLTVPEMQLGRSGYMIVFLSNESKMNVRFDNLSIVHYKGKLQEESHYYPYGLTITSKAFTGAAANNTLYQGKGLQKEEFANGTGLDWYDFSARAYDAQVGMFHAYDPLAEGTPSLGAYQYCNNNPVIFSDPTGMRAQPVTSRDGGCRGWPMSTCGITPMGADSGWMAVVAGRQRALTGCCATSVRTTGAPAAI